MVASPDSASRAGGSQVPGRGPGLCVGVTGLVGVGFHW